MPEANIFELAELGDKADVEKNRQASEFARLGVEPPREANINVFQQAEADLKKAPKASAPEDIEPGWMRKAYNFMGGASGLGGTAGSIGGAFLAPETGGLSLLIPVLAAAAGGAGGAALEGKSPLKEGLMEGGMQGFFGGAQRLLKPIGQFAKSSLVKTFAGRDLLSQSAEDLLKRWLNPATTAKTLYDAAEATRKIIPMGETSRTIDDILKPQINRMPLPQRQELLDILGPLKDFVQVGRGRGFQMIRSSPVADAMADVRNLGMAAKKAFSGKTPNNDLGRALNQVRASLIDDLEKSGVPEVRAASKAYRKEAAIEDLARLVSKPGPLAKLADFKRENPLFKGAFTSTEEAQIDRIVKKMTFVTPSGGAGILGKVATAGMGGIAGGVSGIPFGAEIGGLMGYAGSEYLRELFASPWGRNFMERTLEDVYKLGPAKAANLLAPIWSTAARGLMARGEGGEE